jgi:hypothetical protein
MSEADLLKQIFALQRGQVELLRLAKEFLTAEREGHAELMVVMAKLADFANALERRVEALERAA